MLQYPVPPQLESFQDLEDFEVAQTSLNMSYIRYAFPIMSNKQTNEFFFATVNQKLNSYLLIFLETSGSQVNIP